jgi:hypothetical protein
MEKKSYKNLYLDILKIGADKANNGLSYKDLKSELEEKKGYDFKNDCIEKAVKHWFSNCFVHLDDDENHRTKEICTKDKNLPKLEDHLNCNYILKGDACLTLLNYNNTKRTLKVALCSCIVAFLTLLYTLLDKFLFNCL